MGKNAVSLVALTALLAVSVCADSAHAWMTTGKFTGKSGTSYRVIYKNNMKAEWVTKRPEQYDADRDVLLSIPAAFTDKKGRIGGVYAIDGEFFNLDNPDRSIGGVVYCIKGSCSIKPVPRGDLSQDLIDKIKSLKGDLFQQFIVVFNGKAESFKDKSKFQRRGIATMEDGRTAIVESDRDITLNQFGAECAAAGIKELAYTDMGWWDEGWYRLRPHEKPHTLGKSRMATNKQTNWLTFTR